MDETWEFLKRRCDNAQRDFDLAAHRVATELRNYSLNDTIEQQQRCADALADWQRIGDRYSATVTAMCQWRRNDQPSLEAVQ